MIRWLKNRLIRWLGAKWYAQRVFVSGIAQGVAVDETLLFTSERMRALHALIRDLEREGYLEWIEVPCIGDTKSFILKIRVI